MLLKTILIGLCIFRCGGEKSVHGRPSCELALYDYSSQNTEDFAMWCKHNFLFWTLKDSLLEQGVKQHDLHDNGRNTIKGGTRETKGQKSTGGGRTGYRKWEIVTPLSPHALTTNNNACIYYAMYNCKYHTCVPFSNICDGGNSRGLFDRFSPDKLLSRP